MPLSVYLEDKILRGSLGRRMIYLFPTIYFIAFLADEDGAWLCIVIFVWCQPVLADDS